MFIIQHWSMPNKTKRALCPEQASFQFNVTDPILIASSAFEAAMPIVLANCMTMTRVSREELAATSPNTSKAAVSKNTTPLAITLGK